MYNYGFRYIEGANLFRDFGGHMDEYYDKIYTLENILSCFIVENMEQKTIQK